MTCGPAPARFRILDRYAHWTADLAASGEAEIGEVIRLRPRPEELRAVIDRFFLPPELARGCGPCDWFLVTDDACPCPGLWRMEGERWRVVRPGGCRLELERPVAVAGSGERLAVRDAGRGEVLVLSPGARRIARALPIGGEGPIALDPGGRVHVAVGDVVVVFGSGGERIRRIEVGAPVTRLRAGDCGDLWISSERSGELPSVWRYDELGASLVPIEGDLAAALGAALTPTAASRREDGFCLTIPRGTDAPRTLCFDRCGRPAQPPGPPPPTEYRSGVVTTVAPIDSHVPRCRWHRVRLDAELPPTASVTVEVAATETPSDEPPEAPHADDWQVVSRDALDFLVDQPAGRYLHLRITLGAHGDASPIIRRVRLDFPRSTSAEWLPAVHRDAPGSGDFLDRFLSLFDAGVEDLDRAIARFPALLDPRRAHDQLLPWLGSLLAVTFDPSWSPARRRDLLLLVPELHRMRGTPDGVRRALAAITGVDPAIEELGAPSPFGALVDRRAVGAAGGARLGEVRLFGRGRARARLGGSALGATQLKSYGDPADDASSALAFRVRVQVPASAGIDAARLERLVASQLPAHLVASVRVGARAPAVGVGSAVGIDTSLTGLARPILGRGGNVRLRRRSVVWPGAGRGDAAISIGRAAAVGIQTILR